MWNNVIFGFLLIATVCTQCQSIGYPNVKPDNPLELPSEFYDKTNVITGSAIQHATNTAQEHMPEEIPADDNLDKTIAIPEKKYQVTEHVQEDEQHLLDVEHHHHGEDGVYNSCDDGTGWDIRKSVPGEPGRDYPTYGQVVDTSFTCAGKAAGYYADLESRCQIFRICTTGSVDAFNSFLCPNGSLFNQAVLTCDWWPNVDCQGSAAHYNKNNGNIAKDFMGKIDVRFMLDAPLLHPYMPVDEPNHDDTSITNNHIPDIKIYNDFQVTPEQNVITSNIRYTSPNIQIPSTSAPIIPSSISTQQYQTGTYVTNEKPTTDSLILPHEIPANTDGNVLLVTPEQNKPVTFDQTNVHEKGPEKISLLAQEHQKQIGLLPNVIGTQSGVNIQTGSSVNANTETQVIGGLNLANDAQTGTLNAGAYQSETFAGLSKSIELPGTSEVVQTSNGGIQQHYARILSQGNAQSITGPQNVVGLQHHPDQTVQQFGNVVNQQRQSGTQQQVLHNQALNNFAVQPQNIHNDGATSFPSRFNANFQVDAQNQGVQSNFGLQNQQQSNIQGYNQAYTGQTQSVGLQNQQGFQSNFGLTRQNGYNYNQGFTSDSQNQGGSLAYNQNAFSNPNSFTSNQNAGFSPNFHEQNYQNFNYYATNSNGQNANYEVSKNGAAQNYKGESLSQHANGHTHSSYSGQNYAYKQSIKVEVVPSLGFTLTDELGRASYADALINGLVQEKRGTSATNHESIAPSDVRFSSYQGPSSYLVPQSSVQHLPNAKRDSNNQTTTV
ncbi:uncharacterized protein CBL_03784 [Carabus blaptoides fortunei]